MLIPQQWIKATDAIGIISKSGRYGYSHTDIAFEFALWISPELKINYRIHSDTVKLVVLINLEDPNADLIRQEVPKLKD